MRERAAGGLVVEGAGDPNPVAPGSQVWEGTGSIVAGLATTGAANDGLIEFRALESDSVGWLPAGWFPAGWFPANELAAGLGIPNTEAW